MNVKIALAQVSASKDMEANLKKAELFIKEASNKGANFICFPEMAFMRFFPQYVADKSFFDTAETIPGPTLERFQVSARANNIVIILNIYEKDGSGIYFNTSPVIDADGSYLGKAQMIHIAEEPFFHEKYYYQPGKTGFPVFRTKFGNIGISICYDRHFPEHMRALTLKGADIIFIPQAGIKDNPVDLYEIEMQGASFSNQVFAALCNRVGLEDKMEFIGGSFVTGPSGEMISRAGDKEELVLCDCDLDQIEKMRQERPFLRDRRPELYDILHKL
ncbi:nitrilase-related carbon-nitrogen hydrolase [candidate division KSB1 bacterium]